MVAVGEFNAGSVLLAPLVDRVGLPLDQINFLVCQLTALFLSFPFRKLLHPAKVSPVLRHVVEILVGFSLAYFCFGYQVLHLLAVSTLCYACLLLFRPSTAQRLVLAIAMTYLSIVHIYRMYYDYGGYTLDVTGPLMVLVQRVTALAFSVGDGTLPEDRLSPDQREQRVRSVPTPLEFYSYMFYFHGVLCGPLCFYADYKRFVEGRNYRRRSDGSWDEETTATPEQTPSPLLPLLQKTAYAVGCAYVMTVVSPSQPTDMLVDPAWIAANPFHVRLWILVKNVGWVRGRYYLAWVLGDLINNNAGLGYSGVDPKTGREKWSLCKNVDIRRIEMSTSLKVSLDCWNKQTALWLRRIVYDRLPNAYNLYAVYFISALWHGFYPGYYVTFFSVAFLTQAARKVRRNFRHHFQSSPQLAFFYDALTWISARVACPYLASPFLFLSLRKTWTFYSSYYFFLHLGSAAIILLLPDGRSSKGNGAGNKAAAGAVTGPEEGKEAKEKISGDEVDKKVD